MSSERERSECPLPEAEDKELTWFMIVVQALASNCPAPLPVLYAAAEKHTSGPDRICVRAKVRQVLYACPEAFVEPKPGVWDLSSNYSPEEAEHLRAERKKRLARPRANER